jgi:hypothetical protein
MPLLDGIGSPQNWQAKIKFTFWSKVSGKGFVESGISG